MKTLGADTTAILVAAVAPSSNCLANLVAVSLLYWVNEKAATQMGEGVRGYPELADAPILRENLHG